MFFITIIDFDLKTISYQIAGKIAAHMTQANDADPLNRRLHCLLPKGSGPRRLLTIINYSTYLPAVSR